MADTTYCEKRKPVLFINKFNNAVTTSYRNKTPRCTKGSELMYLHAIKPGDNKMQMINGVYPSSIWKFSLHNRGMSMEYKYKRTERGHHFGIFHGDDDKFWVVSGRDIKKLRDAGYEQINE